MKIRVYNMTINEDDETGVDINSFVQNPAHMRSFETYNKKKQFFAVDTEKRMVLGVAILADRLIYRNDKQLGEHYVKFKPDVIEKIQRKFFKNGFNKNTNVEHEFMVDGAILVTSYIVNSKDPRSPGVPAALAKQDVTDGSWILGYYIENEKLWQDCKKGIFTGFSIEGYFDKVESQLKTKSKMADKTKDKKEKPKTWKTKFEQMLFGDDKEKFNEVTTADGQVLSYEGDLAVGTVMMITDADGEMIPAPAGDYQCEADGKTYAITLDDKGAITAMEEAAAMTAMEKQMAAAINKVVKAANAQFTEMQKEIDALTKEVGILKGDEKFSVKGKKTGGEKKGFRSILNPTA